MRNDTKFFGYMMLLLLFSLCRQPCVQGQEKIVSDNSKWKVSWQMFSGRPDPSYLLNDDEIAKVKKIISREVTRANEIVVAPDKDGKSSSSALNDELQRYSIFWMSTFTGMGIDVMDGDGNRVCFYKITGSRILIYSFKDEVSTLYEMDDNELEKYLVELASQKKEFSAYLSPEERDDILNKLKIFSYEDSRRNKKGGKEPEGREDMFNKLIKFQ